MSARPVVAADDVEAETEARHWRAEARSDVVGEGGAGDIGIAGAGDDKTAAWGEVFSAFDKKALVGLRFDMGEDVDADDEVELQGRVRGVGAAEDGT